MSQLLAIIEIRDGAPVVITNYGPVEQTDFETNFQNGIESQRDWVEMFVLFHEMGEELGIWDETGFKFPYTVGSGVKYLLGEVQKKEKGVLPKEWHSGMKGRLLSMSLSTLYPYMEQGQEVKIDFERFKKIGEKVRVLLAKNVERNPELQTMPGLDKLKAPDDGNANTK